MVYYNTKYIHSLSLSFLCRFSTFTYYFQQVCTILSTHSKKKNLRGNGHLLSGETMQNFYLK